jgi:hypothetical protein
MTKKVVLFDKIKNCNQNLRLKLKWNEVRGNCQKSKRSVMLKWRKFFKRELRKDFAVGL